MQTRQERTSLPVPSWCQREHANKYKDIAKGLVKEVIASTPQLQSKLLAVHLASVKCNLQAIRAAILSILYYILGERTLPNTQHPI